MPSIAVYILNGDSNTEKDFVQLLVFHFFVAPSNMWAIFTVSIIQHVRVVYLYLSYVGGDRIAKQCTFIDVVVN